MSGKSIEVEIQEMVSKLIKNVKIITQLPEIIVPEISAPVIEPIDYGFTADRLNLPQFTNEKNLLKRITDKVRILHLASIY